MPAELLGLASCIGSASAECAWVLWIRTQVLGSATTMNVLGAHQALAECKNAERESMAEWRTKFPGSKVTVKGETMHVWREENMVGTMITLDYYCLPDTVDPRGPKGK